MGTSFSKYEGCGNDFILIDNRTRRFASDNKNKIFTLCHRINGIGADGLILLENSPTADFRMRIFNSDGSEAEMCGNGIRCLARFIEELGFNRSEYTIETLAGLTHVIIEKEFVSVRMPLPKDLKWEKSLELKERGVFSFHFLNTGVPHAILLVEDLSQEKWMQMAPEIRHHPLFSPAGTNVNFVQVKEGQALIRTFERGVEGETLACGTGATAAALAINYLYQLPSPITILPKSEKPLKIFFKEENGTFSDVRLAGPAQKIFCGEIILD